MLKTIYQERWCGEHGQSKKVSYDYTPFPTGGTTPRFKKTTYPKGTEITEITEVYASGIDDTLSRVSERGPASCSRTPTSAWSSGT